MGESTTKADDALRTISEVSELFGIAQHILRYWETRFPQLRPLTRAGGRRYYRPQDVELVARIDQLLNREGYTIRGVQKVLAQRRGAATSPPPQPEPRPATLPDAALAELRDIRAGLARALAMDAA